MKTIILFFVVLVNCFCSNAQLLEKPTSKPLWIGTEVGFNSFITVLTGWAPLSLSCEKSLSKRKSLQAFVNYWDVFPYRFLNLKLEGRHYFSPAQEKPNSRFFTGAGFFYEHWQDGRGFFSEEQWFKGIHLSAGYKNKIFKAIGYEIALNGALVHNFTMDYGIENARLQFIPMPYVILHYQL